MTFRLIDDVLSVDNQYWKDFVGKAAEHGGIYPAALTYNETSKSPTEVTFLGMRITDVFGRTRITVYDKRADFGFPVRRYPHMKSLIPTSIPYGVFVGYLHRYYRICTDADDFLAHSCTLASTLIDQGCHKHRLLRCFRTSLYPRTTLDGKAHQFLLSALSIGRGWGTSFCPASPVL